MERKLFALVIAVCLCTVLAAQKKDEIVFTDAIQVDSSEYFMIPRLLDDQNKGAYGKGKGHPLWGSYTNISFYNTKTNQIKKLFQGLALIRSFFSTRTYYYMPEKEPEVPKNILSNHIVYLAVTHDFNNDKALDSDDPVYLYLSTKTGEGLRQITPNGFHVLSWTVSKDKKVILVRGQNDKSGNKKFGDGDDHLYYRIDLDDDVSRVKCYQVEL